jgi:hypothetical protein
VALADAALRANVPWEIVAELAAIAFEMRSGTVTEHLRTTTFEAPTTP